MVLILLVECVFVCIVEYAPRMMPTTTVEELTFQTRHIIQTFANKDINLCHVTECCLKWHPPSFTHSFKKNGNLNEIIFCLFTEVSFFGVVYFADVFAFE